MAADDGNQSPAAAPFRLESVLVEPGALRISGERAVAHLEPKVMALLAALSERPGRLWTREELLNRLWVRNSGRDETLTRAVYLLRKVLDKAAGIGDAIKTVPRLGYRLDANIREANATDAGIAAAALAARPFSIAILPVEYVSPGGENRFLADGLTRDLTTLLARVPRFRVAPYSSAARLKAGGTMTEAGETLQTRYVVSATLARSGDSVRIRAELSDAVEDLLLWAEKYETVLDRFYEVQEEIVLSISTAIAARVNVAQPERVRRSGRFDLSAYERIQAAEALRVNYGRDAAAKIVDMLEQALAIEPDEPVARAALAVQLSQNVVSQWESDPARTMERADALIAEALAAAPDDPDVLAAAGVVAAMFHRPEESIRRLRRSVDMNPNDAHALAVLGWQICLRHSDPAGIGLIETAEARAPHHPRFGLWATYRATGYLFMLDYANGLTGGEQAVARTPKYYQPHLTCAWAHMGLGDRDSAAREVSLAQALESEDILRRYVEEMRKWSAGSPNRGECWRVLEELQALQPAA